MPRRFPIQLKLTIGALIPLFIAILICWLTGFSLIASRIVSQAQDRVRTDLNSAHELYHNELERIGDVVKFTGRSPQAATALDRNDLKSLDALLSPLMQNEQLDFLTCVNTSGRIVFRAGNYTETAASQWSDRMIRNSIRGHVVSGTTVIPYEDILKENPRLAETVEVPMRSTPHGRRSPKQIERSGMCLVVAAPVQDTVGTIVGVLYGGVMLNNNNRLVDRIKRILFEGVHFDGKDAGTATIFLDDLRIATNVAGRDGQRAIGTLMSERVYDRVILKREKWTSRAFVFDDWYFAAYEPILDLEGQVIGALYVGMMEKPYLLIKNRLNLIYAGVLFFGSLAGVVLSWLTGSHLARPIRRLEAMARRVATGEREMEITVASRDEIGDLASEFNQMTRALRQRDDEIRKLNRGLEQKVVERTVELEEKNLLLLKTREDLVRAEKLAAVVELAAGVAHEVNNPMAIIRGNAELLQMAIPADNPSREEVDIIVRQVGRVERIVASLLKFAHQEPKRLAETDVNRLLDEVLDQLGHQVPMTGVHTMKSYAEGLPPLPGDPDQLRQVLTNLLLNAVQAMAGHGTLTVTTEADWSAGTCIVTVTDTGKGIAPESLGQLFNPFFTTRADGTGLGLSVSYGIVKDHGGRIEVESQPGNGATFRVILPISRESAPSFVPA
jgi:two-component system NtrC family sensor kinase